MMNEAMMMKVEEAKKMMAHVAELGYLKDGKFFCPSEYEQYRYQWEYATGCVGDTTLYGAIHGVSVRALLAQATCLQTREPRA